jgi:hypothetical protein
MPAGAGRQWTIGPIAAKKTSFSPRRIEPQQRLLNLNRLLISPSSRVRLGLSHAFAGVFWALGRGFADRSGESDRQCGGSM